MKHIDDKEILSLNLEKHSIQQYFSFDITPYSSLIYFNAGEYILKEGSFSSDLYYITDGKAKLYLTHKKRKNFTYQFFISPLFYWRNGTNWCPDTCKWRSSTYSLHMSVYIH